MERFPFPDSETDLDFEDTGTASWFDYVDSDYADYGYSDADLTDGDYDLWADR